MVAKLPAGITALDMATKLFGAARRDGGNRAVLHRGQTVRGAKRRAVTREDLGQFYSCRIRAVRMRAHGALTVRGWRRLEQIKRCVGAGQVLLREMEVARGGGQIAMAEQALDGVHVGAGFQQMRGERVSPMSLET